MIVNLDATFDVFLPVTISDIIVIALFNGWIIDRLRPRTNSLMYAVWIGQRLLITHIVVDVLEYHTRHGPIRRQVLSCEFFLENLAFCFGRRLQDLARIQCLHRYFLSDGRVLYVKQSSQAFLC